MEFELYNEDCLKAMKNIPDGSIDMVLCDPPYGTTANKWDSIIDFGSMWQELERVIKDSGAIVLFASGSFTHKLIVSNEELYRYKWIWKKTKRMNFVNAKNRPMTAYEEILIFSKAHTANGSLNKMKYNPQGLKPCNKVCRNGESKFGTVAGKRPSHKDVTIREWTNYPCDILEFDSVAKGVHPSQKPVDLLSYLIKTYTNEGETVLDFTMGSGSTGVACVETGRNFIGIELDTNYYDISCGRIEKAKETKAMKLF